MADVLCDSCKFCIYRNYGYSNWTVEGTSKECGAGVHEPFDSFYKKGPEWEKIPTPCPRFETGDPIRLDVEMEVLDSLSDEEKRIIGA